MSSGSSDSGFCEAESSRPVNGQDNVQQSLEAPGADRQKPKLDRDFREMPHVQEFLSEWEDVLADVAKACKYLAGPITSEDEFEQFAEALQALEIKFTYKLEIGIGKLRIENKRLKASEDRFHRIITTLSFRHVIEQLSEKQQGFYPWQKWTDFWNKSLTVRHTNGHPFAGLQDSQLRDFNKTARWLLKDLSQEIHAFMDGKTAFTRPVVFYTPRINDILNMVKPMRESFVNGRMDWGKERRRFGIPLRKAKVEGV
jgi:hypothetical protein